MRRARSTSRQSAPGPRRRRDLSADPQKGRAGEGARGSDCRCADRGRLHQYLLRAVQTADAVAFRHDLTLSLAPEAVEVDLGHQARLAWRFARCIRQSLPANGPSTRTSRRAMARARVSPTPHRRFLPFVREVMNRHAQDSGVVVIVAHAATLGFMVPVLANNGPFPYAVLHPMPNTGIIKTEPRPSRLFCLDWLGIPSEELNSKVPIEVSDSDPFPMRKFLWLLVALLGAAVGGLALHRGETISAAWLVVAASAPTRSPTASTARFIAREGASRSTPAAPRRPSGWTTAATSCRRTAGSSSATTSRRSPAPARWSARRSPRSSAICPARSGSSSASCSAARCRTS